MVGAILALGVMVADPCSSNGLRGHAETARENVIIGRDGAEAIAAWRQVLSSGGAVAWGATEYNVDARSGWVFAFDRSALRIYRGKEFGALEREVSPCLSTQTSPEAVIPWESVREIEAGNWVLWFRLKQPVEFRSDRGKRKTVKELKVYFHGAPSGTLTYHYNRTPTEYRDYWGTTLYRYDNLRGIAVGPTEFQRRLQFVLSNVIDPHDRIEMKRKGRGAGW